MALKPDPNVPNKNPTALTVPSRVTKTSMAGVTGQVVEQIRHAGHRPLGARTLEDRIASCGGSWISPSVKTSN